MLDSRTLAAVATCGVLLACYAATPVDAGTTSDDGAHPARADSAVAVVDSVVVDSAVVDSAVGDSVAGETDSTAAGDDAEIACFDDDVLEGTHQDSTLIDEVHPQDASEERGFTLSTRNGESRIRFRGSIRLNGLYDFNGLQSTDVFDTSAIPVGDANRAEPRFLMSAGQTRFGIEAVRATSYGDAFLRIEADFQGQGNTFRLRHAYGSIARWTIGQTWTAFGDIAALPLTVDSEGPVSAVSFRVPQVRYSWGEFDDLHTAVSVESPLVETTQPDTLEAAFQSIPDLIARARKTSDIGHLQIAGVLRGITFRTLSGDLQYTQGWGGTLSGHTAFTEQVTVYFQTIYGSGVSRYVTALQGDGLDIIFNPETGEMEAIITSGGYVGLGARPRESLAMQLVVGSINVLTKDFQSPDAFSNSQNITVNVIHDLAPGTRLGIEYLWGRRENKNNEDGTANRLLLMMYYDF